MDNYQKKEVRGRRRKKLVEGPCSICGAEAQIPWMEKKYCYYCWSILWKAIQKEALNEKKKNKEAEEARQKEIEETIRNFLRNK